MLTRAAIVLLWACFFSLPALSAVLPPYVVQEMMWDTNGDRISSIGMLTFTLQTKGGECPYAGVQCSVMPEADCVKDLEPKAIAAHAAKWECVMGRGKM